MKIAPGGAIALALLLCVSVALAVSLGAVRIAPEQMLATLTGTGSTLHETLVFQLRLPRVLQAGVIGSLLAVVGALSQGMFRNPLADPSLIGVTGGASLGGALVLVSGAGAVAASPLLVAVGAFAGGLLATLLVYRIAHSVQGTSVATLLLAGVAITALAGALLGLLELSVDNSQLRRVALWKLGSMAGANYQSLALASVALAAVLAAALPMSAVLNALLLGEAETLHLGFAPNRAKMILTALIAAGMGITVALAGAIAFIGLVVPHMVRLYSGPEHRRLMPRCALLGAVVLVLSDLLSRTLLSPAEIPLGSITAVLGVPYFLFLLRRYQGSLVSL